MAKKRVFRLVRHLPDGELDGLLRDCNDPRLYQRILFISNMYDGDSVPVVASKVKMARYSTYVWAYRWNEVGVDGLLDRPRNGMLSRLMKEQKNELKELLDMRDDWSTREVRSMIEENYGVEMIENGVYWMLRS